jgi:ferrous-iron efflux pump FieF
MLKITDSRLLLLTGAASVATAVLLISVKVVAWYLSDSVAVLASLVDSLMDVAASMVNLLAIRYSLVPADAEHRFGHGNAEALAGLGQAALIVISAVYLLNESVGHLLSPEPLTATGLAMGVMVFSTVITIGLLVLQKYTIKCTGSTAIEADSLHYLSDVAMNIGIILALFGASYGLFWLDGLTGMLIGFYVLWAAWQVGYQSVQLLLDREMPEVRQVIANIVSADPQALGFHQLRTRQSGRTYFIQMHVDMDESLTLREAHDFADAIEARILEHFPEADVLIHKDPVKARPQVLL